MVQAGVGFVGLRGHGTGLRRVLFGVGAGGASGSVKLVAELGAGSGKWDSKGRSGWSVSGSAVTLAYGNVYKAAHTTTCTTS